MRSFDLNRSLGVLLVVCAVTLLAAACDDGGDSGDIVGNAADGATLYAAIPGNDIDCVQCHGAGGKGDGPLASSYNPAPSDLTVTPLSDADLASVIRDGVGNMPAYGKLSDQQVADLVAHINTLRGQ